MIELTLAGIGTLESGEIADQIETNLRNAFQDAMDRPHIEKVRSFAIKVQVKPKENQKTKETQVHITVDVEGLKCPGKASSSYRVGRESGAALPVIYESHETPGQTDFADGEGGIDSRFDADGYGEGNDDDFPETGKAEKNGKSPSGKKGKPKKPSDPKSANQVW